MYIEIRTQGDGKIVKEVELPYEDSGLTWIEVAREFGDALRGMGYQLPKDWDDFLQEQEDEVEGKIEDIERANEIPPEISQDVSNIEKMINKVKEKNRIFLT